MKEPLVPRVLRQQKPVGRNRWLRGKRWLSLWKIKQEDLVIKEKLSKMKLLDSLIAKQEPLADYEEALEKKLTNELLLSN